MDTASDASFSLPAPPAWPIDWLLAALTGRDLPPLAAVADPWAAIAGAAVQHRLAPLLWARLQGRAEAATLPADFLAGLRRRYLANAARNMHHVQELGRILAALGEAGIPAILLKGAFLAQEVYGNLALRVVGDADVLVPEDMLERAAAALEGLGYQPKYDYGVATEKERLQHMPPYMRAEGIVVELHWTIAYPQIGLPFAAGDLAGIWARALPVQMGGSAALALAPEDVLLHLCLHAAGQHLFLIVGLSALFDIAQAITHFGDRLAWSQFMARARGWGMARSAYLALLLAQTLAAAAVPAAILEALKPAALPDTVRAQATANVLHRSETLLASSAFVALGTHPSLFGRVATLARRALLSPTEMARLYPAPAHSWRIFLYYPDRWRYLWRRYSARTQTLLQGDPSLLVAVQQQDALTAWLRATDRE